jgi:TrmH family RNA methyltransferase
MPSQSVLKSIAALKISKYRQKYGQFLVEGSKNVHELIHSDYEINTILATSAFLSAHSIDAACETITAGEMKKISAFATPPGIVAVAKTRKFLPESVDWTANIILALDQIADPGNLGTIVRSADWFGINQIILSENCTDFYNAKTIAATMGSFARCKFVYTNLAECLQNRNTYGLFLDGKSMQNVKIEEPAILVIGSESHGISKQLEKIIQYKVKITGKGKAESLNAGVAASIALFHFTAT